ncbi:MAG: TetR/AcrR family transcriptional regulator [Jatrophihabitans sp.]|uniref:TetR/AcrR family transcriptional regulator n=1 Tax=Jatrophihabitans sp. TaxID=1932789 RepID=UPI003F7D9139
MSATPARLPRGRHDLSRDTVVAAQRERLLRAMAEVMAEQGYVDTSVADILRRAGVSRETFYQQFSSKQDCFVAALEQTIERLAAVLRVGVATPGEPIRRFDRLLRTYLDALANDPATARLFLVESYAAGAEVRQRRLALQAQFVDALQALFGARSASSRFACEALVASIVSLVTARVVADDITGIPALRTPLVGLARTLLG